MTRRKNETRRLISSLLALLICAGCGGDSSGTGRAIDETVASRLVGTWDLTLSLERPLSLSTDAHTLPRHTTGTVALLEASAEHLSYEGMTGPTHMGVFHVDMSSLGFPARETDGIPDLVARVVDTPPMRGRDSVYMLLNPEMPRYAVQLTGTFDAQGITGVWVAESFLGGGGTFVMRRR